MKPNSLALRLVLGAGVWIAVALVAGGVVLATIFRDYVERSFDARLEALMASLVAASQIGPDGVPELTRVIGEPRFEQIYSGWYWEITGDGEAYLGSRSLWDETLPSDEFPDNAAILRFDGDGPVNQKLRLVERQITLPGSDQRWRFAVAGDRGEIDREIRRFNTTLIWSLSALGLGLLAAVLIQVRFGLQPLRRIQQAIVAIRTGKAQRLEGEFPAEIAPLSDELNTLIEHNADVLERARTQVSNLAHGLKTPLSVLTNEAAGATGSLAETVRRQTAAMRRHVDHYLARARTAANVRIIGARTEVAPVAEDLRRTLERIHAQRGIKVAVRCQPGLGFRGDRQDLEEMLGNLMDNACKWAASEIAVEVHRIDGRVVFQVDDDGPGLTENERSAVFDRGTRLDESVPGTGLGLAIVREIAELHGGTVTLESSPRNGLRAVLVLPAALQ
jgi:signal transduction histidine kinase